MKSHCKILFTNHMFLSIRGLSEKFRDWCHRRFISNPNLKLRVFPFKVILLKSNAPSHPSLSRLHALLEGFFRDPTQRRRLGLFDVAHVFKTVTLDNRLNSAKREKITRCQVGEKGGCYSTAIFFSARHCRMLRAFWAGALSWWSIHEVSCHNSRLFSSTERSKRCSISL